MYKNKVKYNEDLCIVLRTLKYGNIEEKDGKYHMILECIYTRVCVCVCVCVCVHTCVCVYNVLYIYICTM